uniref:Uncharacterized protein n=1 Tax=Molossus molossus TaxID=27622 RepID=A0A7J8DBM6_MOLMO|nr:hypothetical protein HJG59_009354 [Molossus molossus]
MCSAPTNPRKWTFRGCSIFVTHPLVILLYSLGHSGWEGTGPRPGSRNRRPGRRLRESPGGSVKSASGWPSRTADSVYYSGCGCGCQRCPAQGKIQSETRVSSQILTTQLEHWVADSACAAEASTQSTFTGGPDGG